MTYLQNRPKGGVTGHKMDFAKDFRPVDTLEEVVKEIKPTVLIGNFVFRLVIHNLKSLKFNGYSAVKLKLRYRK